MTNNKKYLIATAFLAGGLITLGIAAANAPTDPVLPLCPTEDSANCFWDADIQGNGTGTDFVDIDGTPYYPEVEETPAPEVTPEPMPTELPATEETPSPAEPKVDPLARQTWDEGTLECGVNAKPAIDQDGHGNWWAYCEPALVD